MKSIYVEDMPRQSAGTDLKRARNILKRIVQKILDFELIDGDAFLESKDWPYLWPRRPEKDQK